jgi:hypothetical protein
MPHWLDTALWIVGGVAVYLAAASLLGWLMKRNGQDHPATPPTGDEK